MNHSQGCRFGRESSRQTLVNHQYLDPAEGTICGGLFVSEDVFRGQICNLEMDVSKNTGGPPKWMVYNGKPMNKWMIWGYLYDRGTLIHLHPPSSSSPNHHCFKGTIFMQHLSLLLFICLFGGLFFWPY